MRLRLLAASSHGIFFADCCAAHAQQSCDSQGLCGMLSYTIRTDNSVALEFTLQHLPFSDVKY